MRLAFMYIKKNGVFFFKLALNLFIISAFTFLIAIFSSDNREYREKFVNENMYHNFYEYDSEKLWDINDDSFSYEMTSKALSICVIDEKKVLSNLQFVSFDNKVLPESISGIMKNGFVGREINDKDEILISSNIAKLLLENYTDSLESILDTTISVYDYFDDSNVFLQDKKIVGIFKADFQWGRDDVKEFFTIDMVLSPGEIKAEVDISKTRLIFDSFDVMDKVTQLDNDVDGVYFGENYQRQIVLLENQNKLLVKIFLVLSITVFIVILVNCVLLLRLQIKKSIHFFTMINVLGLSKKKIGLFNLTVYFLVILLQTIASFAIAEIASIIITPLIFGREVINIFSPDVILVFFVVFGTEYLLFFWGTILDLHVIMPKKNVFKK